MVKSLHFNHKVVRVTDLAKSERFFGEVLGLESLGRDRWPDEDGSTSTFKTQIGQFVVLVEVPVVDAALSEHWNFMLSPEDFTEVQARIHAEGCAIGDLRAEFRAIGEMSDNYYDPDDQMMQITAIAPDAYETPPARRGKIVAGRIEDFPIGSVTYNDEGKFFIVRTKDGILALSEVCTHRQAAVCYQPEHYRFYCPRHHNKFTRTGAHLGHTPGTPPLHSYPIELDDGSVVVDTDVGIRRAPSEAKRMISIPEEATVA
jgi:nitrite reductase/ring-hydroxylating ferredoxin subunit/predicted enzyme related to lactoylglutathione lyase